MNYMLEIKLFYDWLETHELSSMGITLWHALMQVASRSGWREELQISLSTLIGRTSLSRTSIYKEREILKNTDWLTTGVSEAVMPESMR